MWEVFWPCSLSSISAASGGSAYVGQLAMAVLRHPTGQVLFAAWVAALAGLAAWYFMWSDPQPIVGCPAGKEEGRQEELFSERLDENPSVPRPCNLPSSTPLIFSLYYLPLPPSCILPLWLVIFVALSINLEPFFFIQTCYRIYFFLSWHEMTIDLTWLDYSVICCQVEVSLIIPNNCIMEWCSRVREEKQIPCYDKKAFVDFDTFRLPWGFEGLYSAVPWVAPQSVHQTKM